MSENAHRGSHTPPPDSKTHDLAGSGDILYQIFEYAPDAKLVIDANGTIIKANEQTMSMFGYTREELVGRPIELLIPQRFAHRHVGYRDGYIAAPRTRPMGAGVDLFALRKDSTEFPVDIMLSPLANEHGILVLAVVRDITERKRIEEQARHAREMHIKEIHHRVKNNLQVISSLLYLQSTQTNDPHIQATLKESQSRVKSIALIHEKLYRAPAATRLDFAAYIEDLVAELVRTYQISSRSLSVGTSAEGVHLEVDTAMPCGLIINELVSNVLKYAFPNENSGELSVLMTSIGEKEFRLVVRDNGVGLPQGFDWRSSTSLGLRLVADLVRQLDGTLDVVSDRGTIVNITFHELHYKDRS